ncbi:DnaB-like helicase N-terminal domain-containing protein [Salinibacillus xinjiangensis]|uniref:DNA helicase DnaB-like N-terminal domain-containing protein n=1 Tax=Salinibacillus xinjiangensis TaxID=1229268 RepID=A0A6G1X9L4_9BACI|nr:DnaB-like helicase N-terminal domain-containing protein [Salinibacillus xinjiangensis]MRG87619.1 hypothetical protein [Salinibacillus xinjiangensis]
MTIANYEAETAVLGSVLVDGALFKDLELTLDHFYHGEHVLIFRAMKRAADKGEFIDLVVVTTNLGDNIQEVGGPSYLLKMAESIASTKNLKHYERLVLEAYRVRKAREVALKYLENPTDKGIETLIQSHQTCQTSEADQLEKSVYHHLIELSDDMFSTHELTGYLSTYPTLDDMTGAGKEAI